MLRMRNFPSTLEEYASGGELFDYIVQHQRVPEQQACIFFHQIIAGAISGLGPLLIQPVDSYILRALKHLM